MAVADIPSLASLFDVPVTLDDVSPLSAQRRRTARQLRTLQEGFHPLGLNTFMLPLHADAAPANDRHAPGLRCGTCLFRRVNHRGYPKCGFGANNRGMPRATHGAATDVRAWWPACRDYEEAETP